MKLVDVAKGIKAFTTLVRDPNRLEEVFEMRESLANETRLGIPVAKLRLHPQAARAFAEKPRLVIDLAALAELPPGSLGYEFAAHVKRAGLDLSAIPTLPARNDYEYFSAHLYETHDLWHVLTGFGTDVAGELGLQGFYATQIPGGLPLLILAAGFFNTLFRAEHDHEARIREITRGFVLGQKAKLLFGVRWEEHFGRPLDEVRAAFNLDVRAPDVAGFACSRHHADAA